MNIRYPIYEGVYRILTYVYRDKYPSRPNKVQGKELSKCRLTDHLLYFILSMVLQSISERCTPVRAKQKIRDGLHPGFPI